ncbi:MAG: cell division protein SepF, partial [Chloroflexi bacterium]|nr:cell division protein SepF [Chloroflexota bacterium]
MSSRRGVLEETYEVDDEKVGLWDKVKGWFGPDEADMEHDDHDAAAPQRRQNHAPSFFPLANNHRQMRISVRLNATTMEHAQEAADSLKDRCQVILNLEHADDGMDRRILDFVSGACYALDGFYQRVGTKVFLFAPSNVFI